MIAKIRLWYRDTIEFISDFFTPSDYSHIFGESDRFHSVLNVVFRFFLKYLHFVFPAVFVLLTVFSYEQGDGIVGLLFGGLLAAILCCVLLFIALMVLMLIESFAKILTSLILFNELPQDAQNPLDAFLMCIITRKF